MKRATNKLLSLDDHIELTYGKPGTTNRRNFESGYSEFKIGALIQSARLKRGLTQEELAEKAGTTKSYISKLENDVKEVRLSTLRKIVTTGLGGELHLSITF